MEGDYILVHGILSHMDYYPFGSYVILSFIIFLEMNSSVFPSKCLDLYHGTLLEQGNPNLHVWNY